MNNNNEEPVRVVNENQQLSTKPAMVPEQATMPRTAMPRQISILNWINQWQPMGIRVILSLPFTGNDFDYVFLIRNGPYIAFPSLTGYTDLDADGSPTKFKGKVSSFGYNNTKAVFLPFEKGSKYPSPDKPVRTLVQYDQPPIISSFSQCFRRWRGDMQYRIRLVAGFATQGYIIATTVKNTFSPIAIYDEYTYAPHIDRQDSSYRAGMMNSYALSDTSMFRHLELTMPYEYPASYYDQYSWLSRRTSPSVNFDYDDQNKVWKHRKGFLQSEPHGDNWIGIGIRGNVEAGTAGAQIVFELEYRCAEGFQFADPFFPPKHLGDSIDLTTQGERTFVIPSTEWTSDGIGLPTKKTKRQATTEAPGLHAQPYPYDERRRSEHLEQRHPHRQRHDPNHQRAHEQLPSSLERLQMASRNALGHSSRNG